MADRDAAALVALPPTAQRLVFLDDGPQLIEYMHELGERGGSVQALTWNGSINRYVLVINDPPAATPRKEPHMPDAVTAWSPSPGDTVHVHACGTCAGAGSLDDEGAQECAPCEGKGWYISPCRCGCFSPFVQEPRRG